MKNPLKLCFCQIGKGGLGGLKRGKVPYFCRGGLSILQVNEGMALGWPQTEVGVVLGGRLRLSDGEGAYHGEGAFRLGALVVSVGGDGALK